jgi:outer membrane receptor protein involved in Fe transport
VRHERFRVNLNGQFDDDSDISTPNILRQGQAAAQATLPKVTATLGPFTHTAGETSVFLAYGRGLHSNDPRGLFANNALGYLAKSTGAEVGLTHKQLLPGLSLSVTAFSLKSASELVFVGDEGTTEAKAPSRRHGFEWLANYQGGKGLQLDAFFTTVDAKFINSTDDGIPNAIKNSAGLALSQKLGKYQIGYRLRYLGNAPLNEDRSIQSNSAINSDVFLTYTANKQWSLTGSIYNLFDRNNSDIEYAQDYFFNGAQRSGKTFHAAVPRQLRLNAVYRF